MKILMITAEFPPEVGSAADLFHELARNLTQRHHLVTVVTTFPRRYSYRLIKNEDLSKTRGRLYLHESMDGIQVIRLRNLPLPRGSLVARGLEHLLLPLILIIGGLFSGKHDIILIYSPPLLIAFTAYFLSRLKRIPLVTNIQDLYPQAIIDQGMIKNQLIIRILKSIERFVYKKSSHITVHSEGNKEYIISRGANKNTVTVAPNWVDTNEIKPSPKQNHFRQEHGLGNKFVVSYAGIMSPFQALDNVINCASLLSNNTNIIFLLVGDGLEKSKLLTETQKLRLMNVKFLPMQPKNKYPQILHASDLCLVTLNKQTKTPVVPAKLIRIMSSGRPVAASVPLDGDVSKIITAANCGIVVEPENPEMLAEAILKLFHDPLQSEEMGRNGRMYTEKYFSINTCTSNYEKLLKQTYRNYQRRNKRDRIP